MDIVEIINKGSGILAVSYVTQFVYGVNRFLDLERTSSAKHKTSMKYWPDF